MEIKVERVILSPTERAMRITIEGLVLDIPEALVEQYVHDMLDYIPTNEAYEYVCENSPERY